MLGYGLWTKALLEPLQPAGNGGGSGELTALLSRALMSLAIDFESESPVSLAIDADVFRLIADSPGTLHDLPGLAGVSKEAIAMAIGIVQKAGLVEVEQGVKRAPKFVRLTSNGQDVHHACDEISGIIEERWQTRLGAQSAVLLRQTLERIKDSADGSSLMERTRPYADGWRAMVPAPTTLPHYPMVLHRGGYPDGS